MEDAPIRATLRLAAVRLATKAVPVHALDRRTSPGNAESSRVVQELPRHPSPGPFTFPQGFVRESFLTNGNSAARA